MARTPQSQFPLCRPARARPARAAVAASAALPDLPTRVPEPRPGTSVKRRPQRSDAGRSGETWHFVCLVQIGNFAALRRHLGPGRAEDLAYELEARVIATLAEASTLVIGRATIEVSFIGDGFADLEATVGKVCAAAAHPFDIDAELHVFELLVGAAGAPRGATEAVRLVEEAEGALDDTYPDQPLVLRDLSAGTAAFDRLTLTRELPRAIAGSEMFLQYQPKVHVRKQQITSAEALVRWQHPTRGLILPGDFITVAEEARQISALTLWTIDEVIRDQRMLAADGHDLTIFINISGQLLGDKHFVEAACAAVRAGKVKIGFEITETAVIRDPDSAIANLQVLADEGIVIAIDDYGAGLSSLAYLKQLPARELKIDKMFVLQLTSSNRDPLIVRSTIDLAHALDMEVTAEGVETQAAMALLSVMGCDMIQGYLISRPTSIDAFRRFLQDYRKRPVEDPHASMFQRPEAFWKSA